MKFPDCVAVVTGAASGMGRELAIGLARRGAAGVAVCDVNLDQLNETVALANKAATNKRGCKFLAMKVDVTDRAQVQAFHDAVVGEMDLQAPIVLFNNAGINAIGKLFYDKGDDPKEFEKVWDRCFNVDFFGVLNFTRVFLPTMRLRKRAALVNTSSINSFYTWPEHSAYVSAKHAVKGLTDSLRVDADVKAPHVQVIGVYPGGVKTNVAHGTLHPNKAQHNEAFDKATEFVHEHVFDLTSQEAAEWILDGVERDQTRILVGYDALCLDAMVRAFPSRVYSFYKTLGEYGFRPDVFTQAEENKNVLTPWAVTRVLASGLWIHVLFMWPVGVLRIRRYVDLRLLAAAAGLGVVGTFASKL